MHGVFLHRVSESSIILSFGGSRPTRGSLLSEDHCKELRVGRPCKPHATVTLDAPIHFWTRTIRRSILNRPPALCSRARVPVVCNRTAHATRRAAHPHEAGPGATPCATIRRMDLDDGASRNHRPNMEAQHDFFHHSLRDRRSSSCDPQAKRPAAQST
jgi:hypothetical protein